MNRPTLIATGVATLLAGTLAFVLIRQSGDPAGTQAQADVGKATPSAKSATGDEGGESTSKAARKRQREETANQELVAKYGESRTNLSKQITGNVIGLLDDALEMGEMAASGTFGGPFGGRSGIRMGLGRVANDLNLTEEQQEKAATLYAEFQKRELEKSKQSVERLRKDPTPLVELMLASDAFARGEITEDEYRQLQNESGGELQGIVNPLNERNFRGGRPLRDDSFVSGLEAILDPTQTETLRKSLDEQKPAATPAADEANIASMPSMELEKLDTTIQSVRKLTTGFKSVMEGFGGLQDIRPMLEQQRGQQQSQEAQQQEPQQNPPAEQR